MGDDQYRRYSDSSILETIPEQQDDEIAPTISSKTNDDSDDNQQRKQRDREEVEQFEALEKELAANRHGFRVKFSSKIGEDGSQRVENIFQGQETTFVRTLPLFYVQSNEDQVTKHFYENNLQPTNKPNLTRSPSEADSLEENLQIEPRSAKTKRYSKIDTALDSAKTKTPSKSILKKGSNHDEKTTKSRSPSPSPSKVKSQSAGNDETNDFPYIADLTAKQVLSSRKEPVRSLFEPTINIFDSTMSGQSLVRRRPSRLRYYIKPYRGEANQPIDPKLRSRSLSDQRTDQETPTVNKQTSTFYFQFHRPGTSRKQHVSWSPVREYIRQGREQQTTKDKQHKKEGPSNTKLNGLRKQNLSSSNPCLPSGESIVPVTVRFRPTKTFGGRANNGTRPTKEADLVEARSVADRTDLTPTSHCSASHLEQEREAPADGQLCSSFDDLVQQKEKRRETLQRYDRLLEKMKMTDEQLQKLSSSWNKVTSQPSRLFSKLNLNGETNEQKRFDSPLSLSQSCKPAMTFQFCLFVLVIVNVFLVILFKELHLWWNKTEGESLIVDQRHDN